MSAGISAQLPLFTSELLPMQVRVDSYEDTFEQAMLRPSHYRDLIEVAVTLSGSALLTYGASSWLSMRGLVERELEMHWRGSEDLSRYTIQSHEPWQVAGRSVRDWCELRLIVEEPGPAGERGWRLRSREVQYAEEGEGRDRRVIRIRCLPPEEQAARHRLEAYREKAGATWDRKARHRRQAEIEQLLRDMLRFSPNFRVQPDWIRRGPVPRAYAWSRLCAAFSVVAEAHHAAGLTRRQLDGWIYMLTCSMADSYQAERRRKFHEAAARAALPDVLDLEDADADALDFLV